MAAIIGTVTVNNKMVLEVDGNPSTGLGTVAPRGSMAMFDSGTLGQLWIKTGADDTAWSLVDVSDQDWSLSGNNLTGSDAQTPDQKFGSINDYDVVFVREDEEVMRMVDKDLLIGLNATLGGRLQVSTSQLGDVITKFVSPAGAVGGADVIKVSAQRKIQTVDAALVILADIAVPVDSVMKLKMEVVARQHAGSAGAEGDGAVFERDIHARNNSGTVVIRREQNSFTSRDVPAFDLQASINATNVRYQVKGDDNKDVAWYANYEFMIAVD